MPAGNTQITCGKVTVEKKQFKLAKAGQLTPYPCAKNLISVTLVTNYVPDAGMYLLIDGLPLSVFQGGDGSALNVTEVAEGLRTGENNTLYLFTNPQTNEGGQGLVIADKDMAGKAHLWFKLPAKNNNAGDMQPMKEYIFSFAVQNPGSPLNELPQMTVSAYPFGQSTTSQDFVKYKSLMGAAVLNEIPFEYDKGTDALCKTASQTCVSQVYMPEPGEARPLFIRAPKIISSFAGQSKPYAGEKNVITVSLQFNVHLYPPTKVQLTNLVGVKVPVSGDISSAVQIGPDTSTDIVKYDSTGFCPDILDGSTREVQGNINADGQEALSVTFSMKPGTNLSTSMQAATPLTIRMGIQNPVPHDSLSTAAKWETLSLIHI